MKINDRSDQIRMLKLKVKQTKTKQLKNLTDFSFTTQEAQAIKIHMSFRHDRTCSLVS